MDQDARIAEEKHDRIRAIFPKEPRRPAHPRVQDSARRPHRQPRHSVGIQQGDKDQGGYHLVWSRDMVETAGGLLAAGAHEDARRVLSFLQRTQQPDGHWPQNMWLDGSPYWNGIQMDETALPILLVDLAHREKALAEGDLTKFWPMVKKAAGYLARNGPVSPQDRWEEDPGYTPFTVAAEIAALLAAADLADLNHESSIATYLREIADVWNTSIERWMYMSGHGLVQEIQGRRLLRPHRPEDRRGGWVELATECQRQECDGLRGHPPGQSSDKSRRAGAGAFWFARGR